jgi:predicted ferric reductase
MDGNLTYYVTRACGLAAWMLLTASVVWGLVLSTKVLGAHPRPAWNLDLHRYLGGLAAVFTALHVVAILLDSYVHFSLVDVLVPLTGSWHPGAVAWGIVGLYLLLAVELTSLARHRLPKKLWRVTHVASFPLYLTATVHAVQAGTDRGSPAFVFAAVASAVVVAGLTGLRVSRLSAA